jgi:antitoxin HicB
VASCTVLLYKATIAMEQEFRYTVTLRPEPEGGFTVRVPALPEIVTYGESKDEAFANAREAIELVVESRAERGEAIPASDVIHNQSVTFTLGMIRALEKAGFVIVRTKGRHTRLVHHDDPSRATTVSDHKGKAVPKATRRDIIKQAGLTVDEVLDLLLGVSSRAE